MSDAEKNTLFLGVLLLVVLVLVGTNLTDRQLNRLILLEQPISVLSVSYEHGVVIHGPQARFAVPALTIGELSVDGDVARWRVGGLSLELPLAINWGNLGALRSKVGLLTK